MSVSALSPADSDRLFDPDSVHICIHALERYVQRRNTTAKAAEFGIRRLLAKASCQAMPRLQYNSRHGYGRIFRVGELKLVMDGECSRLITFYRQ